MLQYFRTILPSVEGLLWVVALMEACDVTNNVVGGHLGFYQELEIRLKLQEMVIFFVLDKKNNT